MIVYKGKLLKKIFKQKIGACPVIAGHFVALEHSISFETDSDLAANLS